MNSVRLLWQLALKELRDGLRNRWVAASILLLGGLALALSLLGSAPTGSIRASAVSIAAVSGRMSEVAITYPVIRWQVIMGKFIGHVLILFIAILAGYGGAALGIALFTGAGSEGWPSYLHMMATSLLLGSVFVALGYLVSVLVKERATAAGAAIGLWLVFVVLYDLVLFGLLLLDEGQRIGQQLFTALMLVSPTDTYRIINLSLFEGVRDAAGLAGVAGAANPDAAVMFTVLILWVLLPLAATLLVFQRREL